MRVLGYSELRNSSSESSVSDVAAFPEVEVPSPPEEVRVALGHTVRGPLVPGGEQCPFGIGARGIQQGTTRLTGGHPCPGRGREGLHSSGCTPAALHALPGGHEPMAFLAGR